MKIRKLDINSKKLLLKWFITIEISKYLIKIYLEIIYKVLINNYFLIIIDMNKY